MQGPINLTKYAKIFFIPCEENNFKPKSLESRSFFVILTILVVVKVVGVISFYQYLGADIFNQVAQADIYSLTNSIRKSNNIPEVTPNSTLELSAQMKLEDMFSNNYFAHESPKGSTPWTWFDKARYNYSVAGENLAMNFFSSNEVIGAWLNSETHKKNLLYKEFSEIGVAVGSGLINNQETLVVVQHFAKPLEVSPKVVSKVVTPKRVAKASSTPTPKPSKLDPLSLTARTSKIRGVVRDAITENQVEEKTDGAYYTNVASKSILMAVAILVAIMILLKIFVEINVQYPVMIMRGVVLALVCAALIYVDDYRFLTSNVLIGEGRIIQILK